MKVRVLRPAFEDLAAGRRFYGHQEQGVGNYFFDSLFQGLTRWCSTRAFTLFGSDFIGYSRSAFRMRFTIESSQARRWCFESLIAVATQSGFEGHLQKRANQRVDRTKDGPANRNQPIGPETNRTSSTSGSRR